MRFKFFLVGTLSDRYLEEGVDIYLEKIKHYLPVTTVVVKASKEKEPQRIKNDEAERLLKLITNKNFVILLDEKGKQFSSADFAKQIQKWMNQSISEVVFVTGGAYGAGEELLKRADLMWSFSFLTFTHQMIRLMLVEQLYRAMTILKGAKYHH
jgi:23S rRNA (pseudouridine1915-N3)-methyltransferase